jgi:peptide/nickel transport system substrate-binding protein
MVERRTGALRAVAVGVALAVALVASACGGGTTDEPRAASGGGSEGTLAPVDGGSLVVGVQGDAGGWNTHISAPAHAPAFMVSTMLESLAVMAADGTPEPWLATSWEPNDTFTEWEVKLRDDVSFQNGEKFDAAAVVVNTMDAINGLVSGQVMKGAVTDVVAVDPYTVKFTVADSWAAFPNSFLSSALSFQQAPSALIAEDQGNKNPIGTGPFKFEEWIPGDHLSVVKNPTYWQPGQPHLDEIEFKIMGDTRSRADALLAGDIDMMLTVNALDANDLEADGYQVIRDWDTQAEMVVLNTAETSGGQPNALHNIHARKALAYATDQEAVAAAAGDGIGTPTSPFSPESPWGQPEEENGYPGFDLEKAKEEVEAYKQDTGEETLTFRLASTPDVEALAIAQLIQSQWKEAGIDAKIETVEAAAYTGKVVSGGLQAAILAIYNAPDPDQSHYFWSSTTIGGDGAININLQQYTTPEIDEALKIGRESADPQVRKEAYDELVRQLNAGVPNVWLYWTPYTLVADQRVHGLESVAELPLANFQFKPYFGEIWVSD